MYILTGFDSAGVQRAYVMDDSGAVTGDDELLTGWLGENPYVKPEPIAGETAPASGALTPSQVEAMRQHVSKLLTVVQLAPQPVEPEVEPQRREHGTAASPPEPSRSASPPTPAHRHTTAELEAMTVADLRSLAAAAQIAGASSMSKAELVAALQAQQPRGGSER